MSRISTVAIRMLAVIPIALLLAACDQGGMETPEGPSGMRAETDEVVEARLAPEVRRQLAELRAATAPYHRFEHAVESEYDVDLTGCRENPPLGGMGHHYGNLGLLDGDLRVAEPEVLLFEPQRNGRMRLVGVEYIATGDQSDPPPTLMGETFVWNTEFGVWTLHAWVWKHNPSGVFADWNPTVSCEHAGG